FLLPVVFPLQVFDSFVFSTREADPHHKKMRTRQGKQQHRNQEKPSTNHMKILREEILVDLRKKVPQALLAFRNQHNPRNRDQQEEERNNPDDDTPGFFEEKRTVQRDIPLNEIRLWFHLPQRSACPRIDVGFGHVTFLIKRLQRHVLVMVYRKLRHFDISLPQCRNALREAYVIKI